MATTARRSISPAPPTFPAPGVAAALQRAAATAGDPGGVRRGDAAAETGVEPTLAMRLAATRPASRRLLSLRGTRHGSGRVSCHGP
jgi:hypothetical protein